MQSDWGCEANAWPDADAPVRVALACEERYRSQAQPAGLATALLRRGAEVLDAVDGLWGSDVVVARGRSEAVIETLELAEARGVPTVNTSGAVRNVVDKAVMHERLSRAEVPMPEYWIGGWPALAVELAEVPHPLVVKPVKGDNCRDVHVVPDGAALAKLAFAYDDAVVQRYVPNDGFDLKLYGIGQQVWAVRKPSPLRPDLLTGPTPMATTSQHASLACRCALAVGLDLFGVDCIDTPAGLLVIEINDFPNYSGLHGVDDFLAEYVLSRARILTMEAHS